jgi:hypothetical protein
MKSNSFEGALQFLVLPDMGFMLLVRPDMGAALPRETFRFPKAQ